MQRCEQALVAKIRDYYLPLLLQHDDDLLAVGYKREALAETRFLVLSEVGDLRDASILEAGCGVGNLLAFLKRHGYAGDYTGIDLMPEMIERARLRHPEARFEVGDFNAVGAEIGADYVLASGVYQHAGHEDFLRSVETMFSACRIAAAFNMFSLWCPQESRNDYLFVDPLETAGFCSRMTSKILLRHEYMPHDFTIYMFR